jgi:hypothetical protein
MREDAMIAIYLALSLATLAWAPDAPAAETKDSAKAGIPEGWREYTPKKGGFTLHVPPGDDPKEAVEKVKKPKGDIEIYVTRFNGVNGNSAVVVVYGDYPAAALKGGADAVLDNAQTGILLLPPGAEVGKRTKLKIDGNPGRDFPLKLVSDLPTLTRVVLVKNRMVQITIFGELAKDDSKKDRQILLDSLKFTGK